MDTKLTSIDLEIMAEFTKGYTQRLYSRGLSKKIGYTHRTISLSFKKLEEMGVLSSNSSGRTKEYFLKNNAYSKTVIKLAETYKLHILIQKNSLIKEIADISNSNTLLFGSYAKGEGTEESDIDIITTNKEEKNRINRTLNLYNKKGQITLINEKDIREKLNKDYLLKEATKSHIILSGELFINMFMGLIE